MREELDVKETATSNPTCGSGTGGILLQKLAKNSKRFITKSKWERAGKIHRSNRVYCLGFFIPVLCILIGIQNVFNINLAIFCSISSNLEKNNLHLVRLHNE